MVRRPTLVATLLLAGLTSTVGLAISGSEIDTFENGTTEGWLGGTGQVTNELGGPKGPTDRYLQIISEGQGADGSRMTVINRTQWTGDYNSVAPVIVIAADLNNLTGTPMNIRIGVSDSVTMSPGGTGVRFVSATPIALPGNSGWVEARFVLSSCQMTSVGDAGTLSSVLDGVAEFRILSNLFPSWIGERLDGTLGVDNFRVEELISATPIFCDGFESGDLSAWSSSAP